MNHRYLQLIMSDVSSDMRKWRYNSNKCLWMNKNKNDPPWYMINLNATIVKSYCGAINYHQNYSHSYFQSRDGRYWAMNKASYKSQPLTWIIREEKCLQLNIPPLGKLFFLRNAIIVRNYTIIVLVKAKIIFFQGKRTCKVMV